ncbi:MAG: sugar transferase [Chloroflexota bacterium]|nr:MAG: sugar transferase [Chloroflexota bacterium]
MHSAATGAGDIPEAAAYAHVAARRPLYESAKRVIDVAFSLAVIVLLAPLWVFIALLVKLTSPGPILFRADAVGLGGRPYACLKFRTMRVDEEDAHHREWIAKYVQANQPYTVVTDKDGNERQVFKVINDARVTSIGRFLRKSGLDEVPQFVNVLRGDMSVVGPRPPRTFEYAHYNAYQRQRLGVLPGITGLYQVTARSTASFDEVMALDLRYIATRSIALDLAIMARTIPVLVFGRGGF